MFHATTLAGWALQRPQSCSPECWRVSVLLFRRQRNNRFFVFTRPHFTFRKNGVLGYPFERFQEHLFSIGFENESFARSPAARVHHVEESRGELLPKVMSIEVGSQIDIALCRS